MSERDLNNKNEENDGTAGELCVVLQKKKSQKLRELTIVTMTTKSIKINTPSY